MNSGRGWQDYVAGARREAPAGAADRPGGAATAHGPTPQAQTVLLEGFQHYLENYQSDRSAALELVSMGESSRDETMDVAELASYTMVASLILNLDGTITKE